MNRTLLLPALLAAWVLPVQAHMPEGLEWSGSGFLTAVAGRVLGGTHDPTTDGGYRCPCFISDYAQGGIYERGRVRVGPDSRLGFQGSVSTSDRRFGLTGQVVMRGTANGAPNLEWAYGTAELDSRFTLQVGRKRLPLFAYSEVQDVGFAVPWTHLPPQLYGWEIVNYNGASLTYRDTWGRWAPTLSVFGGAESARNSGYWKIYNGKESRTDARWSQILGTEWKFNRGPFDARYVYMQSYTQNRLAGDGPSEFSPRARQRIHGASFSHDDGHLIARAEFLAIDRTEDYGRDNAQLFALGYRIGRFTPLLSYANYRQKNHDPSVSEAHDTRTAVLRYDLTNASALKIQFDAWRDRSAEGFASMRGHARLLTIGFDMVF
jgi:hypothetical protein